MREIDCRGMVCPAPVLHVREVLGKTSPPTVTVLVDNEAARQNVSRFLEHNTYRVLSEKIQDGFRLEAVLGEGEVAARPERAEKPVVRPEADRRRILVLVTSEHLGQGDDGLGDMLMFNFLKTLKEMGPDLWRVIFVNGGVRFTAEGSDAVPVLRELVEAGVEIFACGVCLGYFHLLDSMGVGEITNMMDIVAGMKVADSVITV
ncbi:MAG: sulfurtransferase-like selenium metabolism protein YedF [Geobacteraceae bacterium]|nr:sulfurtransferase-like selenium metabolism protein YedF [Geobacteraceae bacterium]